MNEPAPADLEWKPVRPGGAAFGTHELVVAAERLELRPSKGAKVLVGMIALAGVATMLGGVIVNQRSADLGALVACGSVLAACVVMVIILRKLLFNYRVFDRELGRYWDTREGGDRRRPGPKALALTELRGVQVTRERVAGPDSNYDADELNLVLVEGRRINVIDHGDAARLRHDAEQIAAWLALPLWVSEAAEAAAT